MTQRCRPGLRAFLLLIATVGSTVASPGAPAEPRLSDYIRPFVGTQGEGNTYPGPSAPFGMVQLSPDTTRNCGTPRRATNTPTRPSWASA